MFHDDTAELDSSLTLLEVKVLMEPLLAQIRAIACVCFTSKFIDDILAQKANEVDKGGEKESEDGNGDEFKFLSLLYQRDAFTAANLQEQLEENLERIRRQQWLEEFPRGAKLLTYLYRIMLACEADLQVIDLLRQIFAQSCKPVLLMTSQFITLGTFEDPFDEFFVEKLFRPLKQAEGVDMILQEHQEVIYKLAGAERIPVFLNDSALTIFKIGCDINLLKNKRQKIIDETKSILPDYFAICC